ncbi:MAG: hypothetical protein JWM53_6761 [bacterium]|nr:hypothetical protein [bacterium]
MKRSAACFGTLALLASGCFDDELERVPTHLDDAVQLGNRDPGPACCGLEAVEVCSGNKERATLEALRAYAVQRAANYIVVDAFSVYEIPGQESVHTQARLFRCPPLTQLAHGPDNAAGHCLQLR